MPALAHVRKHAATTILLAACSSDASVYDRDLDGVPNFDDCAPDDASVYPNALEICDGKDNDCDSQIDEGIKKVYYVDSDGDGHGDPATANETCQPPAGALETADDCDDDDATRYPGAIELCDQVDNDCNDVVDDVRFESDFEIVPDEDQVRFRDAAGVVSEDDFGNYVRLTRSTVDLVGQFYVRKRVPSDSWRVRFKVRMRSVGDRDGEGLALMILGDDTTEVDGGAGENLGVYGAPVSGWALEFDVFKNNAEDTTGPNRHVSLHRIDDYERLAELGAPGQSVPNFIDGVFHLVDVIYDQGQLTVRYDDRTDLFVPPIPLIIPSDQVSFGWSAATSLDRSMQFGIDDVIIDCPEPAPDTGL